jgi:hypothetical protein
MEKYDIVLKALGLKFKPHQINVNNIKNDDGSVQRQEVAFYTSSMRNIFRLSINFEKNTATSHMLILENHCTSDNSFFDLEKIQAYKDILHVLDMSTLNEISTSAYMNIISLDPFKVSVVTTSISAPPLRKVDQSISKKLVNGNLIENVDIILDNYGLKYNNANDLPHILEVLTMIAI